MATDVYLKRAAALALLAAALIHAAAARFSALKNRSTVRRTGTTHQFGDCSREGGRIVELDSAVDV